MKEATLLFLVRDDQVLLAMKKRGFGANRWNGVGGKIEPGETIEEAAIRECEEEIDVTPDNLQKMALLTFKNEAVKGQDMKVHVFVAYDWEGEPTESEEMAPEWFFADMLPFDKMWADDEYWLPAILSGQPIIGNFTFDADDQILHQDVSPVPTESLV
jgi:8-oxo-dGTP pyrophosphatase MutT (NUDIX family)